MKSPTGRKGVQGAFTLIELLVVISIIALLISILLPALGAARRVALQLKNNTQLRGMQQGMVTYAQSNNHWFPGLDSDGNLVPNGPQTLNSGFGGRVEARFAICLKGGYFPPEYAISPAEREDELPWDPASGGPVSQENFSYALSKITGGPDPGSTPGKPPTNNKGRSGEWRDTLNSEAIALGDRTRGGGNGVGPYFSVWTDPPAPSVESTWQGGVAWGDGHVEFLTSHVTQTRYTGGPQNEADSLFAGSDGSPGAPDEGSNNSYNAYLVATGYQGTKDD